jgi:hypothetical protein
MNLAHVDQPHDVEFLRRLQEVSAFVVILQRRRNTSSHTPGDEDSNNSNDSGGKPERDSDNNISGDWI